MAVIGTYMYPWLCEIALSETHLFAHIRKQKRKWLCVPGRLAAGALTSLPKEGLTRPRSGSNLLGDDSQYDALLSGGASRSRSGSHKKRTGVRHKSRGTRNSRGRGPIDPLGDEEEGEGSDGGGSPPPRSRGSIVQRSHSPPRGRSTKEVHNFCPCGF